MQPRQDCETPQILQQGQNSRVELHEGGIIVKHPRNGEENAALQRETEVLRRLQGLLPLDIPKPLDGSVLHYAALKGEPLNRETLLKLPQLCRDAVAAQLGFFLQTMHTLPAALLDGLALPDADTSEHWREFYRRVSVLLFPGFRPDAAEAVRWSFVRFLNRRSNFAVPPVVLHGDFGPTNLLYDARSCRISVIDFGGVRLGDPATDIAALMGPFGYGEAFVRTLAQYYPAVPSLLERARFYKQTFALEQALWALECGDREAYDVAVKKYI